MRKLRAFWYVFWNSLTSPSYYKKLLKTPFSFSLKYLTFLSFILGLFSLFPLILGFVKGYPNVKIFQDRLIREGRQWFPRDLVVTIKNGELSTNVREPYTIDFPFNISGQLAKEPNATVYHAVAIDTNATADDFVKYHAAVLITKRAVAVQSDKGIRLYPFTATENMTINKELFDEYFAKSIPYIQKLPSIVLYGGIAFVCIYPFFVTLGTLFGYMIFIAVMSIISVLIAKLVKRSVSYGTLFRLGMHGVTIGSIVHLILSFLGWNIPFLSAALFVVWMIVVLSSLPRRR